MSQAGGNNKSFKAGIDLNTVTACWSAVYINSAASVAICNSTTHKPIGILQNQPKTGTGASCWVQGTGFSKLLMNDSCTAGDLLVTGSGGIMRGTALSITSATIRYALGRALETSAISGTVIEVILGPFSLAGSLTVTLD